MFGSSMMLTVGQALDRALHEELTIEIRLGSEWLAGRVTNSDSQGVMIAGEDGALTVVRMDAITAVRMLPEARADHLPTQPTESPVPVERR